MIVMGSPEADSSSNEPLTPFGRLFLQPQVDQIIHCAIGFENPIDIDAVKSHLKTSLLLSHPRFSSLMIRDSRGLERWEKTHHIDLDRHVIVLHNLVSPSTSSTGYHETAVNHYLADLSTSFGLSTDKPLWEFHLLMAHNCGIFRIHHAVGDAVSLMSLFSASFRPSDENGGKKALPLGSRKRNKVNGEKSWWVLLIGFLGMLWFSLVFVVDASVRSLWVCDRKTEISGGDGVELWPRKLATARFRLEDMKLLKKGVPNAALTMHMVSYGEWADMQILVAKDIIPDPEFLAQCFEEALLCMKEGAATIITH